MHIQSVRFGVQQLGFIRQEADAEGVSLSQFIRDAAYGRAMLYSLQRRDAIPRMYLLMLEMAREVGSDQLLRAVQNAMAQHE